jgi:hypothetical protein
MEVEENRRFSKPQKHEVFAGSQKSFMIFGTVKIFDFDVPNATRLRTPKLKILEVEGKFYKF